MVSMPFVASTTRNKMHASGKKARGKLWQSEVFFPLADHGTVVIMSCPSRHSFWFLARGFRSSHRHLRYSMEDLNIVCVHKFSFLTERGNQPVTAIKWPSMCWRLDYAGLDHVIGHFRYTANWKSGRRKTIRTKNCLHDKTLRIKKFTDSKFPL